jgi:hypothetical protein
MEARPPEPFNPMMAMWLTLPGAAMCSLPIGLTVIPRFLLHAGSSSVPSFRGFNLFYSEVMMLIFVFLIPATAISSRKAYRHCISTTGYPAIRMVLMLFNFIARGLADLCIALILIGAALSAVAAFMKLFSL